jgi:hypothetical protein
VFFVAALDGASYRKFVASRDPVPPSTARRWSSVLGAGGGGESYATVLMATQALLDHGPINLVEVSLVEVELHPPS